VNPIVAGMSQRDRLLDGMARAVAEHGYGGTAVADVLKAARISRRTFYEQFIDKEDCFLAAYDTFAERCAERVVAAYDEQGGGIDGLARALGALLGLLAAEPHYARLAIVEVLGAGPRALARRDRVLRRLASVLTETTRSQLEPSSLVSHEVIALAVVGGIADVLHGFLLRGEAARLPQLSDDLLRFALLASGASATA
jgi:AcrR family transcriptional regulator